MELGSVGCVSGMLEFSGYGWNAKPSSGGVSRPLAWYAAPRSRMNVVGEWVSRPVPGRSIPRGARAPPQTLTSPFAFFDRVVGGDQQREVGGRRRVAAVLVELRHPEAVEVRLVADDHVADLGHLRDDRGDVRRELPRAPRRSAASSTDPGW